MNSLINITAKRSQLSLHLSSDISPPYARYILGVAGQIVLTNHYLVHIRWLPVFFINT